ncbi:hypothetical protein B0F90DRAFT_1811438 [Multifurca ochricompacta]|uniref:HECT-type E3 ubiquitin transferase n=1 Tax=Multifurca ochricompacta TaxID=376703 RepID=A0AAD4QL62_9AGAM|nr:hypothetical protein B0F90DRAFT_1811438 [Multifurca ochricompacta]
MVQTLGWFFDPLKRRKINLGGAISVASQTDLLHNAKARRTEREEIRRRHESALCIQRHWRGFQQSRATKRLLFQMFQEDVLGLNGMRALILIGNNDQLLAQWSDAVISARDGKPFILAVIFYIHFRPRWSSHYINGPDLDHWIVLVRQMALLLLRSVAYSPRAPASQNHLRVLDTVLSPTSSAQALGRSSEDLRINISNFLLRRGFYPLLSKALGNIVRQDHLPTFGSSHQDLFIDAYTLFIQHVLTLPLLPNRLPLTSLAQLSANLPSPLLLFLSVLGAEEKLHLLANLAAFVPPGYPTLPSASLMTLLRLMAGVMSTLPVGALEPKSSVSTGKQAAVSESDSDSEDSIQISSASYATPVRVLSTIVVSTSGGLVRELYRGHVRSSPLGREDSLATLLGISSLSIPFRTPRSLTFRCRECGQLAPLLFLTDLYTHSLLTMGDDDPPERPTQPSYLDEIISLSRKLLNIAFTLFWREDQFGVQDGYVPGLNITWDSVRRKVIRFLQAVHSRDSRRSFMPPGHWLVEERIDIASFVEAAVVEEQQLVEPVGARPLTKRAIAYLSPRLGVLNNIPFAIPFEARVKIFRSFIENDKRKVGSDVRSFEEFHTRTRATVRRGHVAEDGFDKLGDANLKRSIEITFIDQFGEKEMGIDGGGVFKEFLTELSKEVFDSDRGLWLANKKNELYPSHGAYATEPSHLPEAHSLDWYRFIGRILGKALYEGILVDVAFAGFFLSKWLGKQSFLDDLASLDPDLYQGLIFLKHYPGNPEELSLNFTIVDEEFGVARTIDLKPNGSNIPVTRDNKLEYILRVSHYRLTKQIKEQSDAFFDGLSDMIDPRWLRMFNQQELQVLLGGVNTPIDLEDLRRNTNYGGLYDDQEPTIVAFWKVVESFDPEQRRALLRFVTSVGRPPLLGFSGLVPKFCIRDAGGDENRLPTSSTCVNLLKLPRYKSENVLRRKLLQAVFSGAGFDLS